MTNVLLTGAGFSRNWGGWLAKDAFEYLLGAPEVDDNLRNLLWQDNLHGGGFEDTLARLQAVYDSDQDNEVNARALNALTSALVGMFNAMGNSFMAQQFEFQNDLAYTVARFLSRFDAIFTLNQDTLLELHYLNGNIALLAGSKFSGGWQLPGMRAAPPGLVIGSVHDRVAPRSPLPPEQFRIDPSSQPYFKLHGSANWNSEKGRVLIMGGNKSESIKRFPILAWYHTLFRDFLMRQQAKLMIVGYSFGDRHINEAIVQALAKGLKLFIIDPVGTEVLVHRPHDKRILPPLTEVLMPMLSNIIGASRRPLYETFNRDHVEHAKVMSFFA